MFACSVKIAAGMAACSVVLVGCASKRVDVVERGVRPPLTPGSLRTASTPPAGAEPLVADMTKAGLMAAGPEAARVVDVGYSERPLKVGAYSGPPPADDAEGWTAAPDQWRVWRPRQRMVCTLSLRIADASQAAGGYEVRASRRGRGNACGGDLGDLTSAIGARLTLSD